MTELEKRVEWLELQMKLVHRTLDKMADRKTEPTSSKMEQVDKDINVRSKTEPQEKCYKCFWWNYSHGCQNPKGICEYKPYTERSE